MLHHRATLFSAVSATGNGSPVSWPGGHGILTGSGTFSGTTLSLEYQNPVDNSWVPASTPAGAPVALTAAGQTPFVAPVGNLRGVLTSGTPASLSAVVGTTAL